MGTVMPANVTRVAILLRHKDIKHQPGAQAHPSYLFMRAGPEATGGQQQDLRTALGVGLARRDLQDAHGLLEDATALRAAQPDDAVAAYARGSCRVGQGPFFDDGPDGMVAEAAAEVAAGVDDVLEELLLGRAAVDDVEALGLQGGPQLLGLRAVAGGQGRFDGHAFADVEMDVPFGGVVLRIEPQGPGPFRQGGQQAALHGGEAA